MFSWSEIKTQEHATDWLFYLFWLTVDSQNKGGRILALHDKLNFWHTLYYFYWISCYLFIFSLIPTFVSFFSIYENLTFVKYVCLNLTPITFHPKDLFTPIPKRVFFFYLNIKWLSIIMNISYCLSKMILLIQTINLIRNDDLKSVK